MRRLTKKVACVLLAMSMLVSIACPALADNEEEQLDTAVSLEAGGVGEEQAEEPADNAAEDIENEKSEEAASAETVTEVDPTAIALAEVENEYKNFLNAHKVTTENEAMALGGSEDIAVPLDSVTGDCTKNEDNDIVIAEEGYATFELPSVPEGLYQIRLEYDLIDFDEAQNKVRTRDAECAVLLDGKIPYAEARDLTLSRLWRNKGGKIERDANNNDIKPAQEQITKEERGYLTQELKDAAGYYSQALLFDFSDVSELTFVSLRESVIIHSITLVCPKQLVPYKEYISNYSDKNNQAETLDNIQGEDCLYKSDATLTPQEDRSSPMTYPNDGSKIRLNYIGGKNWSTAGQEVTWELKPEKSGLYEIRLRCRQIYSNDLYSARTLRIDGEIPFAEAADIHFTYNNGWIIYTVSVDGEACKFWLEGGVTHTLSLSVTLGDLGPTLERLEACVQELNNIYSDLIMIMSATPDTDRDYQLNDVIPDTLENMEKQAKILDGIAEDIEEISGSSGSSLSSITKTSIQLKEFCDDPNTIASQLKYYKDNIASLSEVMTGAQARPLDIDYISVAAPSEPLPKAEKNFFQKLWYQIQLFIASFIEDYNSLAGTGGEASTTLTVWTTLGRDQASIINELIRSDYTPNTEENFGSQIGVDLQVVPVDALMPSVAAGNGPDVLLNATSKLPVEYAMRGASANLREVVDENELEEVLSRFGNEEEYTQATLPFTYTGKDGVTGLYGLPDQYLYSVLFYRTDILKGLGIEPPTLENPWTWDDVIDILPILQGKNRSMLMETGDKTGADVEQYGINTYAIFLYQNGGSFYSEDRTRSALDSENAVRAFERWTNLYTNYGLPTNFDMLSRFRTGESPLLITDFPFYNNLSVSAPELKGLWGMTLVPGTVQEDGSVNMTTKGGGTAVILMDAAENKQAGWDFIKWWTSDDTQTTYATNLESLLGTAARYATANKAAFNNLAWSKSELAVLNEEAKYAATIPETPGSYYTPRHINNAFRAVCIKENKEDAREAILKYAQIITDEITDKRKEFGFKEANEKRD